MELVNALKSFLNAQSVVSPTSSTEKHIMMNEKNGNYAGKVDLVKYFQIYDSDAVDLQLPSGRLWSTKNFGAVRETDYGWWLAWAEKSVFENATARGKYYGQSTSYPFTSTYYNVIPASSVVGRITGLEDAAHLLLGNRWHMPDKTDWDELLNNSNTTLEWVEGYNGVAALNGVLVRSVRNYKTIFLPAFGTMNNETIQGEGTYVRYFLPTLYMDVTSSDANGVQLYKNASGQVVSSTSAIISRYLGVQLRPVQ